MSKKELNNSSETSIRSFKLPKSRILKGKRNFENLFSNSSLITSRTVNLRYAVYEDPAKKTLAGFIAPKKLGNAVKRIHTKRLLREAYRLNQHLITEETQKIGIGLHFVLLAKNADAGFEQIEKDVRTLLSSLKSKLKQHFINN